MKILGRRLFASLILLVLLSLTGLGQQAETARLMHHEGVISSVAFNTDGQTLASGSESLYDPSSPPGQPTSAGPGHGPTSASHHAAREPEFMVTLWDVKRPD
jgi:hypothetical protein